MQAEKLKECFYTHIISRAVDSLGLQGWQNTAEMKNCFDIIISSKYSSSWQLVTCCGTNLAIFMEQLKRGSLS